MKMTAQELNTLDLLAQEQLAAERQAKMTEIIKYRLSEIKRLEDNAAEANKRVAEAKAAHAKFLTGEWEEWQKQDIKWRLDAMNSFRAGGNCQAHGFASIPSTGQCVGR